MQKSGIGNPDMQKSGIGNPEMRKSRIGIPTAVIEGVRACRA
jgi:hypothetical protein